MRALHGGRPHRPVARRRLRRDLLIAAALGAGPVADAFFVSLKLANFLRRLFAEGAFTAAFVPLFARLRAADGVPPPRAVRRRGAGAAGAGPGWPWWCWASWLMPWLVRAPGHRLRARLAAATTLAVELGRITFPYLLLISLAALFASAAAGRPALRRRGVRARSCSTSS